MDYTEANARLQGRNRMSRKLANNTYLHRNSYGDGLAVRLHSTDVLTFHPNGRIEVSTGGWNTVTTKDRVNRFLPRPWHVWSESGEMFIGDREKEYGFIRAVTIEANGTVDGLSAEYVRAGIRAARNERRRPINRARYWIRKARTQGATSKKLTVDSIMAEENTAVRAAMMSIYGVERFFLDAKPEVVETLADYSLLNLKFGAWESVKALKMTCPSTGAVYVQTVPPNIGSVASALDWIFNTENYLGQVKQVA